MRHFAHSFLALGLVLSAALPVWAAEEALRVACQEAAKELRASLGDECATIVRTPFIVAGDLTAPELKRWHDATIEPAAKAMLSSYFDRAPDKPITILLFGSRESYERYAKQLFGDERISIYGYYKPARRTLVMNISTGGGTLVHELTHALIDFDFPDVPDWFNEGLASLHEQCRFRDNGLGIDGLENWRLPALQEAIEQDKLGTLESLIHSDDFRGRKMAINYAQARYFCLYMQRHGLLEKYYEEFREHQQDDPRGAAAVRKVFPDMSWAELDDHFRRWAADLEPPG